MLPELTKSDLEKLGLPLGRAQAVGSALAAGVRISLVAFVAAACFHPAGYHFYFFYIAGLAVSLRLIASSIRPRAATATAVRAA